MPSSAIYITDAPYSCDPFGVIDCTTAINAALATGRAVIIPSIAGAVWRIEGALNFANTNTLDTEGGHLARINRGNPAAPSYLFNIAGSYVAINGRYCIDATQTIGGGIICINSSVAREDISLGDITSFGAFMGITDTNGGCPIVHFRSKRLCLRSHRGRGGLLYSFFAHINFHEFTTDYASYTATTVDVPAMTVFNGEGVRFWEFNTQGQAGQAGKSSVWQRGLHAKNCASLKIFSGLAEYMLNHGFYFESCDYVELNGVDASANKGDGFLFRGCNFTEASNVSAFNNTGTGVVADTGGSLNWMGGTLAGNLTAQYNLATAAHHLNSTLLIGGACTTVAGPAIG